jgi:hypothetical protein
LSPLEYAAFWTTIFAYALGTALALFGLLFNRERSLTVAGAICTAGLLAHFVAIGARIDFTGHLPVASRYENVLTGSAVVMLFSLVTILRRWSLKPMIVFVAPFALLMLGYALLEQPRYTTMSLVLDNLWMFIHIFFAWPTRWPRPSASSTCCAAARVRRICPRCSSACPNRRCWTI